jgi:hypothetical protein
MRLIVKYRGGYDEGASGSSFNRSKDREHEWAGRWDDFFASQRYPRTWKIRKWLKKLMRVFTRRSRK